MKRIFLLVAASFFLSACEPEVGTEEWCSMMEEKPRGDWTFQNTTDFAKHCIVK